MELREAIKRVRDDFGRDYVQNKNIVSVLADYGAFKNEPAARIIIKLLIAEKTLDKYLEATGDIERNKIVKIFINNTGISEAKAFEVLEIFRSIICEEQENAGVKRHCKIESKGNEISSSQTEKNNEVSNDPQITISTVSFLGIPFGSKYDDFKDAIITKGGKVCDNGKSYNRFLLHKFLYGDRNLITISTYKYSKIVKKMSIQQSIADEKIREKRLRLIRELYISKYGIAKEGGTWKVNDVRITVKEEKCLFADKISIEYSYLNSELLDYEERWYDRLMEEKKRIAEIKRKEEERKKREEEILAKKRENELRKALWEDI